MKKNRSVFQAFTMIIQFGLNMLVPIVLCTLFGVWLGDRYHMPLITVPLFLAGALAGFRSIYRMAQKIYRQNDEKND